MVYFIIGVIVLTIILVVSGFVSKPLTNAALWMDDSWRWGGKDV